jgi:uncharacterized membrane protein YgdD (TMEM256/DUF423 family)
MAKKMIIAGCLLAAISVVLGAFAAHVLDKQLSEKMMKTFETAAKYQMYHSLGIILCGVFGLLFSNIKLKGVYYLFFAGIVLFSGSLYALCLMSINYGDKFNFLGAITPLGGLCFISGWFLLAYQVAKQKIA